LICSVGGALGLGRNEQKMNNLEASPFQLQCVLLIFIFFNQRKERNKEVPLSNNQQQDDFI
jgi:hypothetical protein